MNTIQNCTCDMSNFMTKHDKSNLIIVIACMMLGFIGMISITMYKLKNELIYRIDNNNNIRYNTFNNT